MEGRRGEMRMKLAGILSVLFVCFYAHAEKADSSHISFSGQVTGWEIVQFRNPVPTESGGRFVPTLLGNVDLSPRSKFDFEASLNINGKMAFSGFRRDVLQGEWKPYRVWGRVSGDSWELRAGLQKINFGSAKMFRPLMWFDAMDVRDPLQLTDGVYGVLGKYFFRNNANLWLWSLIGNKNQKGYELWGSPQWKPEYGGRFETPAGPGEMGLSTHFRRIRYQNPVSAEARTYETSESRIGLDGKWDIGIGIWFESSVTLTDMPKYDLLRQFRVQDMWNVGADYTLAVGSGLGVTAEYFRYHAGDRFFTSGKAVSVLGTMVTYPLSLLDNLSGMVFCLPDQNKWMNYLSWGRTYDNLSIYTIGYWNPEEVQIFAAQSQSRNMFAGKGFQIMINYNF